MKRHPLLTLLALFMARPRRPGPPGPQGPMGMMGPRGDEGLRRKRHPGDLLIVFGFGMATAEIIRIVLIAVVG